jgi:hypothetical protein
VYNLDDPSERNAPVWTLELTQHLGSHRLTVYAANFIPSPGDVTFYRWKDASGKARIMKMPNFCLTNIKKVEGHILQYIETTGWESLKSVKEENDLAWMTVTTAVEYAKRKPVRDT